MEWLLTHMWMALAGVGLFGILLGWAVRGIMVMGKYHRAVGEKEIATAELNEARNELDVLLKAQRGEIPVQPLPVAAGGADDVLKQELKDREKRLADLAGELAKSKTELETLKSSKSRGGAVAAVGGAVAGAGAAMIAGKDGEESPSLAWRNRHLEARLKELEGQVETLSAAKPEPALSAEPEVAGAPIATALSAEDKVEAEKAAWKIGYLNQRIDALEAEVTAAPAMIAESAEPEAGVIAVGSVAPDTEPEEAVEPGAVDEELARLRWRNRYLEGRLAYFEGDSKQDDEAGNTAGVVAGASAAAAAVTAAVVGGGNDDADNTSVDAVSEAIEAISEEPQLEADALEEGGSVSDAILKSLTQADEAADAEEAAPESETEVEDAVDAEVEASASEDAELTASDGVELVKPLALDSPVGGQADDLTVIGGVGPKIQEVLNGLGVYHYDQIAAWTRENIAWIDDHLSFSGRIDREGWVEQALILAGDD